jgi:RNA polymerase-binding transcription factor DksA
MDFASDLLISKGSWTAERRNGAEVAEDKTVTDQKRFETRLQARLRELGKRLNQVERELDAPIDADFEESASEREGDEVLEGIGNAGLLEVKMINAALRRIEDGTFGTCVACGEPIATKRLEAVPHAARCHNCA